MSNTINLPCQSAGCKCVPIASKGLPVSIKLAIDNTMKDGCSLVILPVYEIDGLKVNCQLIVNENGMSLFIKTFKMLMYNTAPHDERAFIVRQMLFRKTYIKKLTKYTLKDYESVIKHMNNDIQVMKFDKLNGVFITPQINDPRDVPHVSSNLEILNSVPYSLESEECSVCLDLTKSITPCGHKLCVSCWCQIKINGRELPCPICRADLLQSKKIGIINSRIDQDIAEENDDDDFDDDDDDDWDDSDDDDFDEFPSIRQNSIMDMN
jgi:hypothetical protein